MSDAIKTGCGRLSVQLSWEQVGKDWVIILSGGERPHIGASAISWINGAAVETQVIRVPEHREDQLVCVLAEQCCRTLKSTVQVSCGIHIDRAKKEEIETLIEHSTYLIERFLQMVTRA
ncbi:hypothetical protein SDC9_85463 [bioreactor metagenome]|uniref:Prenylated flavin chaperone LpdD-like domain-containing protein n=1 Tax=bioreactor metagenome TaxID=1076179 RepID=A0A644ZJG0_9ZZZZ